MQEGTRQASGWDAKFFLVALAHDSLYNFYKMNFALMQFHRYSLNDLESMIPFEREIYVALLMQHLEEERLKRETRT